MRRRTKTNMATAKEKKTAIVHPSHHLSAQPQCSSSIYRFDRDVVCPYKVAIRQIPLAGQILCLQWKISPATRGRVTSPQLTSRPLLPPTVRRVCWGKKFSERTPSLRPTPQETGVVERVRSEDNTSRLRVQHVSDVQGELRRLLVSISHGAVRI